MTERNKDDLKQQVIMGTREYGIGSVLFRHVIGEMLGVNATDMECLTDMAKAKEFYADKLGFKVT
jgi:hypothetical protein